MGERTRELAILVAGDTLCFISALWLTLLVRYFEIPSLVVIGIHLGPFLTLTGIWIFIFLSAGLYDKHTTLLKQALRNRIFYAQITNMVVALLVFLAVPLTIAPKTNLVIYLVISTALISAWRLKFFNYFSPKEEHRAILVADGAEAIELADEINNNERYNYSFVRIIDQNTVLNTVDFEAKLLGTIEREGVSIIVASAQGSHSAKVLPLIFDLAFLRFRSTFLDFTQLYEDTFDRVPISSLQYDWFIKHVSQSQNVFYVLTKRTIDVVGVLLLSIPSLFILPLVALAIWLDDKGPLFYKTERIGQFNRPISIWKFRTKNGLDSGESALESKLVDTRVGSFLRKTRLDELPQLFNVLIGDLSFIGPRPEMPALAQVYAEKIPFYNTRHFIKPGLSGWAQINDSDAPRGGINVERTLNKLSYDLLYLKRRSLWLDLQIVIKTLFILVMRTGT